MAMEDTDFEKGRREIMRSTLELEAKALNYLLAANGAGFASCALALKDYATVPLLHGTGWVVVPFALGLLAATLAFLRFQAGSFDIMRRVIVGDEGPAQAASSMALVNLLILTSGTCFLLGVAILALKLAFL
jgi:hypothetical protein